MPTDDDPLIPSRGLLRKLVENTRRWGNTPIPPLGGGAVAGGFLGPEFFLGVLDEDLEPDGSALCSLWAYDPESEEEQDTDIDVSVRGWMLQADKKLASGARVVLAIVGAAYYVVNSRECPEDADEEEGG